MAVSPTAAAAALMPRLKDDLATLVGIPSVSAPGYPESTRPALNDACEAVVMKPGGYRFGDYWKLGLPLLGWFFLVAVFLVPAIWRF